MISLNNVNLPELMRMHGEVKFDSDPNVNLDLNLRAISDTRLPPDIRAMLVSRARKDASGHPGLIDLLTAVSFESYSGHSKMDHVRLRSESILGLDIRGHSISFTALVEHLKSERPIIIGAAIASLVHRKEIKHAIELLNSEKKSLSSGLHMYSKIQVKRFAHAHEVEHAMEHNHKIARMKMLQSRVNLLSDKVTVPMMRARQIKRPGQ